VGKMVWLIALQGVIIIVLLTFIFRYKRDINYISKQIVNSKGQYSNIRMNSLNKDIERLVININELYEMNQKINIKIKHDEEKLRESIANISHDLRTPLTSIMGYMQLIKEGNYTEEEKNKYIDIIQRRTETLQNLISSFYELSRIECDEYRFNLKSVNLSNALCEIIALFYNEFVKRNIEPDINIEENISPVIADEEALSRIFSNLVNNMLKHGGSEMKISLRQEGNFIVTEFQNDAPNLRVEDVEHIFDRFFTSDITRSDQNTGLGLSITKALVEKLGHKIEAAFNDGILNIRICFKL